MTRDDADSEHRGYREYLLTPTGIAGVTGLAPTKDFPDNSFDAIVFDWDGTAVPNRDASAEALRSRIEALCRCGIDIAVVSGTHVDNVDMQLMARPRGPGRLWLCVNRGSQVAVVGPDGPSMVFERRATPAEESTLDRAASLAMKRLGEFGLVTRLVSQRMNRRKIDLIDEPEWANPPKAQIAALLDKVTHRLRSHAIAGLDTAVSVVIQAALDAGLNDPRVTTDAKHIEVGLTDKSDSMSWILKELGRRGIGAGLVLVVGDELGQLGGVPGSDAAMMTLDAGRSTFISVGIEPEGTPPGVLHFAGGPETFLGILDHQLVRRAMRRVPSIDLDPAWTVKWDQHPQSLERVRESLLVVADGRFGTRGYKEEDGSTSNPLVVASGIYDAANGAEGYLVGPRWSDLELRAVSGSQDEWVLDLRTGVLLRKRRDAVGNIDFCSVRFASLAQPGTMALRAEGAESILEPGPSLVLPRDTAGEQGTAGRSFWASSQSSYGGGITAAAKTVTHDALGLRMIERVAHYASDPYTTPDPTRVVKLVENDQSLGFDQLLSCQRQAWADRWDNAGVSIEGDTESELAVRFALFHLMSSVGDDGETAVGARGLSGPAYAGHVFWDDEIFVMPFLAATHPVAAESMLRYRIARLDAARANAVSFGHRGARFPWESATTGEDVTPRSARDAHGDTVEILTGQLEEHIIADIAWAASHAAAWTGSQDLLVGDGRPLIMETARWWASRAERDADGSAHLRGVIGPDEYHESVDDNAFTNVMAAWNLRRAVELAEELIANGQRVDVKPSEIQDWSALADSLVDGYDSETGVHEQFAGFFDLEPLVISEIASTPVAADVLLGRRRVAGSQIIKQADVLMLHHLVPEACAPGSLISDLEFYLPRVAHGSSLSPAIHASVLARAGRANEALELFRLACRIDLDDLTGTTAGGLHLACLGGVWQALAYGFLGLWPTASGLVIDPHLPDAWDSLSLTVIFWGVKVVIHADKNAIAAYPEAEISVIVDGSTALVGRAGVRIDRSNKRLGP